MTTQTRDARLRHPAPRVPARATPSGRRSRSIDPVSSVDTYLVAPRSVSRGTATAGDSASADTQVVRAWRRGYEVRACGAADGPKGPLRNAPLPGTARTADKSGPLPLAVAVALCDGLQQDGWQRAAQDARPAEARRALLRQAFCSGPLELRAFASKSLSAVREDAGERARQARGDSAAILLTGVVAGGVTAGAAVGAALTVPIGPVVFGAPILMMGSYAVAVLGAGAVTLSDSVGTSSKARARGCLPRELLLTLPCVAQHHEDERPAAVSRLFVELRDIGVFGPRAGSPESFRARRVHKVPERSQLEAAMATLVPRGENVPSDDVDTVHSLLVACLEETRAQRISRYLARHPSTGRQPLLFDFGHNESQLLSAAPASATPLQAPRRPASAEAELAPEAPTGETPSRQAQLEALQKSAAVIKALSHSDAPDVLFDALLLLSATGVVSGINELVANLGDAAKHAALGEAATASQQALHTLCRRIPEDHFNCPLLAGPIDEGETPVRTPKGRYFSRGMIETWLQNRRTDPVTREPLRPQQLSHAPEYGVALQAWRHAQAAV